MSELIARKKEQKRNRLLDAANTLFIEKGVSSTTIADICNMANIAKGTFYLYYKDKEDILRALTKRISLTILKMSYETVKNVQGSFEDKIVLMANYLLDLFENDPDLLTVMKKDFIWPISEEEFLTTSDETLADMRENIEEYTKQSLLTERQILIRIYSLISMLCSISYSSVIDKFPDTIDALKPEIFLMIRNSFTNNIK
jgi:AcrR family transcriptional regulator